MKRILGLILAVTLCLGGVSACDIATGEGGSASSSVAGSWKNITNHGAANETDTLVLNSEGTGFIRFNSGISQNLSWFVTGNNITLQLAGGGSMNGIYAVSGSTMTIDWGGEVDIFAR